MSKLYIVLFPLIVSCQAFQKPDAATTGAALSAAGGAVVIKTLDKADEIAEFLPPGVIENLEVCYKLDEVVFKCLLVLCPKNKICERVIRTAIVEESVSNRKAVVIDIDGWVNLVTALEVKLKKNDGGLVAKYSDYADIDKILIIGGKQ